MLCKQAREPDFPFFFSFFRLRFWVPESSHLEKVLVFSKLSLLRYIVTNSSNKNSVDLEHQVLARLVFSTHLFIVESAVCVIRGDNNTGKIQFFYFFSFGPFLSI